MKSLLLIVGLALVAVNALPYGLDPEYAMIPEEDGTWKLVNIHDDPEPESFFTPANDIIFSVFTSANPTQGQVIQWNSPASILASNFNAANPTRFTIHGWNGGPTSNVNTGVRNALLQRGNFNVIQVNWSAGSGSNYLTSRNRVGPTGAVVADMIMTLASTTGQSTLDMSIIGHSLGAHVAGMAGKRLTGGFRLGSIVALDAANPLFSDNSPAERVHFDDAVYVESIHTNTGTLGFTNPLGDASFYPNGGSSQPGCGIDVSGNCAHGRAHQFYVESITTQIHFNSRPCTTLGSVSSGTCTHNGQQYQRMGGEPVNDGLPNGIFWVQTNSAAPFARG